MYTDELKLSKLLSRSFQLSFGIDFWFLAHVGGFASKASDATAPSGWYTREGYANASMLHSFFWLVIFIFIYGILFFFFRFVIPFYCFFAMVLLGMWLFKTAALSLFAYQEYGSDTAVKVFYAKFAALKWAFMNNGIFNLGDSLKAKLFFAFLIGLFFTQIFDFNTIAVLFFHILYVWPPVLFYLNLVVGWLSLAAGMFVLLML